VDILNFATNTWRTGKQALPHRVLAGASTQFKDTFLIVGGLDIYSLLMIYPTWIR